MKHGKLTALRSAVTRSARTVGEGRLKEMRGVGTRIGAVSALAAVLGGCINIAAPEEPIVIELNVNIRQEVIYRLAEDAADTIEENADIF